MRHAIEMLSERTSALATELEMICVTRTNERISEIVHELAQPLQIVRILGEQLTQHLDGASAATVDRILSQMDGISAILEQANNVAPKPNLQPTPINPVIRESLELVCIAKRPTVQTSLELAPDVMLNIDKRKIGQVLTNLIRNALEAMQTTGQRLLIKTTHLATGIEIAIIDDGPGIDPTIADRLFEPFVTSKPSGAGIGLSISRAIIKAHRGELSLRATSDNKTCFVVFLPK